VQGVSLLAHLRDGGRTPLPDRYLFWDLFGKMAALHGDWKIVGTIDNHHGHWERALQQISQTRFELYNLSRDLAEQNDVADRYPEIYRDLAVRYREWFRLATQ
jgi:arylsulfatase A-like enzyme